MATITPDGLPETEPKIDDVSPSVIYTDKNSGEVNFKSSPQNLLKAFGARLPKDTIRAKSEGDLIDNLDASLEIPDGEGRTIYTDDNFTITEAIKPGAGSSVTLRTETETVILTTDIPTDFDEDATIRNESFGEGNEVENIVLQSNLRLQNSGGPNSLTGAPLFNVKMPIGVGRGGRVDIGSRARIENYNSLGKIEGGIITNISSSAISFWNIGFFVINIGTMDVERSFVQSPISAFPELPMYNFIFNDGESHSLSFTKNRLAITPGQAVVWIDPFLPSIVTYTFVEQGLLVPGTTFLNVGANGAFTSATSVFDGTEFASIAHGLKVNENVAITGTGYNLSGIITAVTNDTFTVDMGFVNDVSGTWSTRSLGIDQTTGALLPDPRLTFENVDGIPNTMQTGGFNSTGTFAVNALVSATFVDMDFTATPVSPLTTQDRFQLIDANSAEFEYIGEEDEVVTLKGIYNMTGGSAGNQSATYEWKLVHQPFGGSYQDIPDSQPTIFAVTENTDAASPPFEGELLLSKGDRIKPQERRVSGTRASFERRPFTVGTI